MKNNKSAFIKKGFTLAEVLVTLLVIGVIAGITIPNLKEATDKESNLALLKKASSIAGNMFGQLKAKYGSSVIYWRIPDDCDNAAIAGKPAFPEAGDQAPAWMYKQVFNVIDDEVPPADYAPKNLKGSSLGSSFEVDGTSFYLGREHLGKIAFQTADGMYWFPSHSHPGCSYEYTPKKEDGSDDEDNKKTINICGMLMVDTNGKKQPNRVGVDIFFFDVTPDGVIPHASNDCSSLNDTGYGCGAKFLQGGKDLDFIYE